MADPKNSNQNQEPKEPLRAAGPSFPADETRCLDLPQVIVGVGAPAGRLDLLIKLFAAIPTGHGLSFVLVQPVGPSQEGLTVDQLKNHTTLKVVEAGEGLIAEADHLYVIFPNRHLTIFEGRMSLVDPIQCHGLCLPIDHFFCALAADQKTRAVGVVLSGTGSDGNIGLSEIRAAGGRTIVEEPKSAEFVDLPPGTIPAGVADQALTIEKIPEALLDLVSRMAYQSRSGESGKMDADFRAILNILLVRTGHDFRCYKKSTLVRRIRRRMALNQFEAPADYRAFLEDHPDEARLLQKDLLIGVTDFFRQPEAWLLLEEKVIPLLIAKASPENPIRVWVPGCSTGKEAYSLAILLTEQAEASGKPIGIQIFATDTDEDALTIARSGIYPEDDLGADISPKRREKFFVYKNGQVRVTKAIRERVIFAPQNLTSDPPFSRLDLISCRNLLIYLGRDVQRQIIALFHFALRDGGFLFLGNAETVSGHEELFEPVFKKWRIYRRIGVGRRVPLELPVGKTIGVRRVAPPIPSRQNNLVFAAQQVLVDRFAPTAVIVDRRQQLLYAHGTTEDYLTIPSGETTMDIANLVKEGLRTRLGAVIRKAVEENRPAAITTRIRRGAKSFPVRATVTPLHQPREVDGLLLISFEEYQPRDRHRAAREVSAAGENDLRHLEDELKITQEELQGTIEQLESSNEELKASNEEAIASNEEMQSANEELETSKEELQSLNEELNTVNARLHEKVEELENTNNDVVNLLGSTNIATIFLDRDFKVMRYTPAITLLLSLIPSDVGRPIADITRKFGDEALLSDARRVLADLAPAAKEVRTEDGRWYIRRITPYRTHDDRIEGVVVTFLDVHDLKQSEQERERLASFPLLNPQPIIEADLEGNVHFLNPSAQRLIPDLEQRGIEHPWLADWGTVVRACQEDGVDLITREVIVGERYYQQTIHYVSEIGRVRIYGTDITDRKQVEETLEESEKRYHALFDKMSEGFALHEIICDQSGKPVDYRFIDINSAFERLTGLKRETLIGKTLLEVLPDTEPVWIEKYGGVALTGQSIHFDQYHAGLSRHYEVFAYCPAPRLFAVLFLDVTERKRVEDLLAENENRLERAQGIAHLGSWELDVIKDRLTWSDEVYRIFGLQPQEFGATYEAFLEAVHPDDRAVVDAAYSGSLREGRDIYEVEHRVVRKSTGETRFVHEKCEHFRDESGKIIRSVGMVQDITERKLAEEALRKAKEEWERTFDSVPDLVAILDDQHRIVRANKAMAERLGCSSAACVGLICYEQVHGTDAPACLLSPYHYPSG